MEEPRNAQEPPAERPLLAAADNDVPEVDAPGREIYCLDQQGDPEVMLAILEKKAELAPRFKAAQDAILASQTYARDWTEFEGRMCLSSAGAERVGRLFDIQYLETNWRKEKFTDALGAGYRYIYECKAALGGRVTYALGVYSSRDAFVGKEGDQYKALEEVDENNVQRSAYSLMKGNAIKSLLGLRGIPCPEWQKLMQAAGQNARRATKGQPGRGLQGGTPARDRARQRELAQLCIAIAQAGQQVRTQDHQSFQLAAAAQGADPLQAARQVCVTLSTFQDHAGQTIGGKGARELQGKWLESTLKRARQVNAQLPGNPHTRARGAQPQKGE